MTSVSVRWNEHMNAWFGDARALALAVRPAIGTVTTRSLARLRTLEDDPTAVLPAVLVLALSLPIALLVGVPTAGMGIGVALGIVIAATVTLRGRVAARRNAEALAQSIAEAWADADHRVMLVTKQYQWAVNDVANLRDALQRARAQKAAQAPGQPRPALPAHPVQPRSAVRLVRFARESDPATTLRFGAEGVQPEQVRLVDGGSVVAISARSLEVAQGDPTFAIPVSEKIAEALSRGAAAIAVEALVDERWHPAEVRSAVAPTPPAEVKDKRGRVWRATSAEEGALP